VAQWRAWGRCSKMSSPETQVSAGCAPPWWGVLTRGVRGSRRSKAHLWRCFGEAHKDVQAVGGSCYGVTSSLNVEPARDEDERCAACAKKAG
jgi:hypothetical protein